MEGTILLVAGRPRLVVVGACVARGSGRSTTPNARSRCLVRTSPRPRRQDEHLLGVLELGLERGPTRSTRRASPSRRAGSAARQNELGAHVAHQFGARLVAAGVGAKRIHVGDREADIFALFTEIDALEDGFVFRATRDRRATQGDDDTQYSLEQSEGSSGLAHKTVVIPARPGPDGTHSASNSSRARRGDAAEDRRAAWISDLDERRHRVGDRPAVSEASAALEPPHARADRGSRRRPAHRLDLCAPLDDRGLPFIMRSLSRGLYALAIHLSERQPSFGAARSARSLASSFASA